MSTLAPNLLTRRFDDLVEVGRSKLPSLAPRWTDYNVHDPGITIMELLAWVTEAQLYSLSRMRHDERLAYAAYFGLAPQGPSPARGLLWPDATTQGSSAPMPRRSVVVDSETMINGAVSGGAVFHPEYPLLWVPGVILSVRTRRADGTVVDQTAVNASGQIGFTPFGADANAGDALIVNYDCSHEAGLLPADGMGSERAYLAVGIRANGTIQSVPPPSHSGRAMQLKVVLDDGAQRTLCPVEVDTSHLFMHTGVCLIDVSAVRGSSARFSLEFSLPDGSARAPRILQIGLNVVPVIQSVVVQREPHAATGLPDQSFEFDMPGLRYGQDVAPMKVEVGVAPNFTPWRLVEDLAQSGPDDTVAQIDLARESISFGNGVNGRVPPLGAQILVTYETCTGAVANTARGQGWTVQGLDAVSFQNLDAVTGGGPAQADADRRRQARHLAREPAVLVTAADIETAALALPDLALGRAKSWVPGNPSALRDVTTLIAMARRPDSVEPSVAPETTRWLQAVGDSLVARMPLGRRLRVVAPRYVDFSVSATLQCSAGIDPVSVKQAATDVLTRRLRLTDPVNGNACRQFGVPVSSSDISAWLRGVTGVAHVLRIDLKDAAGHAIERVKVPRRGLPRLNLAVSTVNVQRAAQTARP